MYRILKEHGDGTYDVAFDTVQGEVVQYGIRPTSNVPGSSQQDYGPMDPELKFPPSLLNAGNA